MFTALPLKEFYSQTLKQGGFTPPEDQIEKFATANKLDVETTKVASAIFEQLQLDGVPYETPQDMFTDALKIAHAYVDHVKEASAQAEKIAGDLHRVARHAVEGYLAQHGIDLNADEGVKIAGLQAQSFQMLTQKQAELRQLELVAELKLPVGKTAGVPSSTFNVHDPLPGGGVGAWNPDSSMANLNTQAGGGPEHLDAVKRLVGRDIQPHETPAYLDAIHKEMASTGGNMAQAHSAVMGRLNQAPKPGLMSRPGVMLGAGALGLGALYMMKKRRDEEANRRSSIMGAASMPAA